MKTKLIQGLLISILIIAHLPSAASAAAYERPWVENYPEFNVDFAFASSAGNYTSDEDYVLDFGLVWENDRAVGAYNPEYYKAGSRVNILMINGGTVPGAKIFIEKGVTLVPIRIVSEILGLRVEWIESTKSVLISSPGRTVRLSIGSNKATVNETAYTLDVPAKIINDSTYVPLRFIGENLGYKIGYTPFHFANKDNAGNFVYFVTVDDSGKPPLLSEEQALSKVKDVTGKRLNGLAEIGFVDAALPAKLIKNIRYVGNIGRYRGYAMPRGVNEQDGFIEIIINEYTGDVYYNLTFSLGIARFSDDFGLYYQ